MSLMFKSNKPAFSLLEMLLTLGIVGTLSTVVISQINPGGMLGRSRNGERQVVLNDMLGAITAFTIDNDGQTPPDAYIPSIEGVVDFSGAYIIHDDMNSASSIFPIDMDNDSDIDFVGGGAQGNDKEVLWWERSGTGPYFTWTKHDIEGGQFRGNDVAAADIDGDLLNDVVSIDRNKRDIGWWRNLGGSPPSFDSVVIVEDNFRNMNSVAVADLDGENGADIIVASDASFLVPVKWYENDGNPGSGDWDETYILLNILGSIRDVQVVDLDGDGDTDVIGANDWRLFSPEYLYWWENDGTPEGNYWNSYRIDNGESGERGITFGDIDDDNDIDIVGISLSGKVEWYENDGNPKQDGWTTHLIADNFGGQEIIAADVDFDNDLDIVAASYGGDKIAYWENEGGGSFSGTYVFASGSDVNGVHEIAHADINEDGASDIITANKYSNTISWWMNTKNMGVSNPAPLGAIEGEYESVCRYGIPVVQCDAYGGVSLDVLIPNYLADIPVDPIQDADTGTGAALTGYEVRHDFGTNKIHLRASLAELGQEIEIIGTIGIANCLVWDLINDERTCVLYE
jgi:type II secretory pathway pseudopilin PulG